MRYKGISWPVIGEHFGKSPESCRLHFIRLRAKTGAEGWRSEDEEKFRLAYQKKKSQIWGMVAAEMGFEGSWQALERKAIEMGFKGLK